MKSFLNSNNSRKDSVTDSSINESNLIISYKCMTNQQIKTTYSIFINKYQKQGELCWRFEQGLYFR